MLENSPKIYFYSPNCPDDTSSLPESVEASWEWFYTVGRPEYKINDGEYAWTYQTYWHLKEADFPCELTNTMPSSGIVLVHRESLPFSFIPGPDLFLICLQADKAPHPFAQLSVVLSQENRYIRWTHLGDYTNPKALWRRRSPLKNRYYIRHWPVPALKPRSPSRVDKCENVAYFGVANSLSSQFRSTQWKEQLAALGFNWIWRRGEHITDWTDYSDIDIVLSVRGLNNHIQSADAHQWAFKPPTKLINAWIAGVPAIMGKEASLREVRQSEFDYIEVNSQQEAIEALKQLRDNNELRTQVLANVEQRAKENSVEQTRKDWIVFLEQAKKGYQKWCRKGKIERQIFWLDRWLTLAIDRVYRFVGFRREGVVKRYSALRQALATEQRLG